MSTVHFSLAGQPSADDYQKLRTRLEQELPEHITIEEAKPVAGAPMADIVLAAVITGGFHVLGTAITAFVTYLIARRKEEREKADQGKDERIIIIIRGTEGSRRMEIEAGEISQEQIEAKAKEVGTVTEVVEEK